MLCTFWMCELFTNEQPSRRFLRFTPRVFAFEGQTVGERSENVPKHVFNFAVVADQMSKS